VSLAAEYSEQAQVAGRGRESAVVNQGEYHGSVCCSLRWNAAVTNIHKLGDQVSQEPLIQQPTVILRVHHLRLPLQSSGLPTPNPRPSSVVS